MRPWYADVHHNGCAASRFAENSLQSYHKLTLAPPLLRVSQLIYVCFVLFSLSAMAMDIDSDAFENRYLIVHTHTPTLHASLLVVTHLYA